jgi:hypothetical protein
MALVARMIAIVLVAVPLSPSKGRGNGAFAIRQGSAESHDRRPAIDRRPREPVKQRDSAEADQAGDRPARLMGDRGTNRWMTCL